MIRQRVHLRSGVLVELLLRMLVSVLGLALVFYGAMVLLAALKLSPSTINQISGYRTVQHALESITAANISGQDRIIVAVAGVLCLIIFGWLAWRSLPRPYLARTRIALDQDQERGQTEIAPRALERAAQLIAHRDPHVTDARARSDQHAVEITVQLRDLDLDLLEPMQRIQGRVRDGLAEQGFPAVAIDLTLAGATISHPTQENQP